MPQRHTIWMGTILAVLLAAGLVVASQQAVAGSTTAALSVGVEQSGHQTDGVFDAEGERNRQREISEWLASERPDGVGETPLAIEVTSTEVDELGVSEGNTRKLRVGVVRPVNARIRFDDLDPADLRGPLTRTHGAIEGTADGGFVWTAAVRSEGATALRVRLSNFFLPAGAEVWIYTEAGEAFGPYVRSGPDGNGDFWTHSVSGSEAFLQLRKRGPVTPRDLRTIGFVVAEIAHIDDSAAGRGGSDPGAEFSSGFCSYNASCVVCGECAGPQWEDVRDAVAEIQFVSGPWVYICSGGLVADSDSSSDIPYFLTANHCVSKGREANSLQAFFQYRSSSCSAADNCNGPYASTPRTRGSSILATNRTSDYTLLRLAQDPPDGSYFLGWTAEPVANVNGAALYRFSHPQGAPQAYSQHAVDVSRPTCSSWPRGAWIYSSDVAGATEPGSSGSPVVDASGRIVGQLSGACGYDVYNACNADANATVDGAFANYYGAVASYLGPGAANLPPTASFTYLCDGLGCNFDASGSTDADGSITSYAWTFGDANSGSGVSPSHTYAAAGTYTVTLTVTDDDGATDSTSQSVTVGSGSGGITLTATGYKVKGWQKADLEWSGATSTDVNVYRDGGLIATTTNNGFFTDNIDQRGGGSYTYQICETGTSPTCSNQATVTF